MGTETLLKLGATALSAYGSKKSAMAARAAADDEAAQVSSESIMRAANIRKLAQRYRGQAVADYAAGGVDVSQGTPLEIDRTITRNSELDAINTLVSGDNLSRSIRKRGRAQQLAGYADAISTLGFGASKLGDNWKRAAVPSGSLAGARDTYQGDASAFSQGLA